MQGGRSKLFFSRSGTFLTFCFCFILGVGFFSFAETDVLFFLTLYFLFFVVFSLVVLWEKDSPRLYLLCSVFFLIGGLRYFLGLPEDNSKNISFYNGREMEFTGVVKEASENNFKNQYVLKITSLFYPITNEEREAKGKILVQVPLYPKYQYNEKVKVKCFLENPKASATGFRYDRYLARLGIWSVCKNGRATVLGELKPRASFLGFFFKLRQKIQNKIELLWPEPEGALMAGLLYGARAGLPRDLLDNFSRVGITHIIAISGYNISIIAVVLLSSLIKLGFYRGQAFWFTVGGIILFVIFTGASASVVRAGIMGVVVLLAGQLGRLSRIGNVLVLTAAVMLLLNPFVLIWDAGFQLSFLATLGLVYLSPILQNIFKKNGLGPQPIKAFLQARSFFSFSEKVGQIGMALKEIFISTLSAIIATLPLILFQFGRLSIVAPLANILVLWIIPYLMFFGFLAVLLGFFFFPIGEMIAWLAEFGLRYVIIIAEWLGRKGWSAVDMRISGWMMAVIYIAMIIVVVKWKKKA